ncbi:MAG: DsbA family protein [Bacteroidetes bacterium]|nr:MAG: DsbA family protein [Bacteroidota bacterium]
MSIQSNTEILYFFDPLCGWCYGYSPVMKELYEKHKDEWRFRVFSGGMMMGNRAGRLDDVAPFVKTAYRDVETRTGVKFGDAFIEEAQKGDIILSSLEPSIVLAVFKSFETGKDLLMASALQRAIYFDGVESKNLEAFVPYAVELGVDEAEFKYRLSRPEYHDKAFDDFRTTQRFGIQGYPATVLVHEDQYYLLGNGYTPLESIEARIAAVLQNDAKEGA